jgi:hypothetical protein
MRVLVLSLGDFGEVRNIDALTLKESSFFCIESLRLADTFQEFTFFLAKESDFVNQDEIFIHLCEAVFIADFRFFLNSFG